MQKGRLAVQKTYKLFIGGKFVRSESGRTFHAGDNGAGLVNVSRASRKDFRDAVGAARKAAAGWAKNSAYLRGQILYRAAEMLEMRSGELQAELERAGSKRNGAEREVRASIDRLVHYAGWTDKFGQIFSSVNPVASSHFNFTSPEATGVVVAICADEPALLGFVSIVAPIILSGNSAVVLVSATKPLPALTLSEVLATSDLPGGVINVLAGDRTELASQFASHMDVNAIVDAAGEEKISRELQQGAHFNVKRYAARNLTAQEYFGDAAENPYWIYDTVEMKTAWHPIGL